MLMYRAPFFSIANFMQLEKKSILLLLLQYLIELMIYYVMVMYQLCI